MYLRTYFMNTGTVCISTIIKSSFWWALEQKNLTCFFTVVSITRGGGGRLKVQLLLCPIPRVGCSTLYKDQASVVFKLVILRNAQHQVRKIKQIICDVVYSAKSMNPANCDPNWMDRVEIWEQISSIVIARIENELVQKVKLKVVDHHDAIWADWFMYKN